MLGRTIFALLLLLPTLLLAADPPATQPWQLPPADAQRWAERLRTLVPDKWTVSTQGNDITIQRDAPVRWRAIEVNLGGEETKPRLHEGIYRLTLHFGPKLTTEQYEHLAAANAQTQKQRDQLALGIRDIWQKFDSYEPKDADQERRLAAYREALARLPLTELPDLYTQDYSIRLTIAGDGWSMLDDGPVAEECNGTLEAILRYFGMYDPEDALDPHNLPHPEPVSTPRPRPRPR